MTTNNNEIRSGTSSGLFIDSRLQALFLFGWLVTAFVCLGGGPLLGDHEVIVAQTARQVLESGEWVVLRYLDTPFLVKPPLATWLVALVSSVIPGDAATSLPVTTFSARVPSVIATFGTILLVLALGRSMYGRRIGAICAFAFACSVGAWLFAMNATVEALLTFFCTWAFAEFWWFHRAPTRSGRILHLIRFYIAIGLAMLAKGPMPLAVVAVPIAAWWWCHRAGQVLSVGGPRSIGRALWRLARDVWPRLKMAITRLGLWWGVPLFLMMFVPWMWLVARRVHFSFDLWAYEYLDRLEGDYPGSRDQSPLYYIPIAFGLMLPWSLSVFHALAAPLRKVYRHLHQPLAYAWYWVVVGIAVMSVMGFKKPYYILPAMPGLALLLGPELDRLFFTATVSLRRARAAVLAGLLIFGVGGIICWFVGRHMYPEEWNATVAYVSLATASAALLGFAWAGWLFLKERRPISLAVVGMTCLTIFVANWLILGPSAANIDDPLHLVEGLHRAGISPDANIYWAGHRPDGRVTFYGRREIRQLLDPYQLAAETRNLDDGKFEMRKRVGMEIIRLLEEPSPVYFVLQREDYNLLLKYSTVPAREIFSVDRGHIGKDKADWVVCTNLADRSAAPAGQRSHDRAQSALPFAKQAPVMMKARVAL